jgi:hypothetical protein
MCVTNDARSFNKAWVSFYLINKYFLMERIMKSMKRLCVLMALSLTPVVAFGDLVLGEFRALDGGSIVSGYVCDRGSTDSLAYHIYVGGPAGVGERIGNGTASGSSDAQVDSDCGHPGEDGSHSFLYVFSEEQKMEHQGESIYIHGIRGGIDNRLLEGSNMYTVAAPSSDPVEPDPVEPDPVDPEPIEPDPIDDTTPGDLTLGSNVTIDRIVLWENSEANPLYFRRSDNVLCYVPAGQSTLQSLILTLYSSGKLSDIHCHAEEEQLMLGIRPAHKLHRIIAK